MISRTAGKLILTATAIFGGLGGFVADWNVTHIYNLNWPPHAKFHNGQTLASGVMLSACALFFLWRRSGDRETNRIAAMLFTGMYFWTQAAANLFPGVAWKDPEFLKPGETLDQFPPIQLTMDVAVTGLVLLGGWLMRLRLNKEN